MAGLAAPEIINLQTTITIYKVRWRVLVNRRFALACFAAGLFCAVPACGPGDVQLAPVKGQVTFQSKPLTGASVLFYAANGPIAIGMTDENGNFRLTTSGRLGAVVGANKVAIRKMTNEISHDEATAPTPEDMRNQQLAHTTNTAYIKSEIPEAYGSPDSSKLTAEVSVNGSENQFQFDLK